MKRDKVIFLSGALSLVAMVIALALGSCTKESLLPSEQLDKESIDLSLELTPPGAFTPSQSRAMTSAQQNAINRAEVLVFQDNTLLYHKTGTVSDIDGVKKRVQVNLKTSQSESDLFDIMVIGNPPASFDFAPYVSKTKDDLKTAFNVSATGRWAGSEFIMCGQAQQTLIKPTTNIFKIEMLRSLARVDLGVGAYNEATDTWAGLSDFKLTEVRVVNSRDKFAVIPSTTTFNENGNVKVSEPTIPSAAAAQGTNATTAIKYSGSTDITGDTHTKSTIFIAEAPQATNRVTLLIGGSYKGGATTYYRIDMCVPKVGAPGSYEYFNILRNHLYRITITSVMGVGFTDPQQALVLAPINTTTTLTPIQEGGMSDVVFDSHNYILTDVSSVLIYGVPNGVKKYSIVTVKANFVAGVDATITGFGITTPMKLASDVAQSIEVAIPTGTTNGSYTITVGRLMKTISFAVQPPVDAHFDFLPFANVASINIANPTPWLTLSQNATYVKNEQQSSYVVANNAGKACFHFDENIATTGESRTAQALVVRNNGSGSTRVYLEQLNLNGMVFGYFGGAKDNYGYTKQLAFESMEEYSQRRYDDTSIGATVSGLQWGFNNITTGVVDKQLGRAGTIALANRTDSGIAGPYTIYNNYAARYCYDKNRDINGDGTITDDEILWYMPAQNQLMAAWVNIGAASFTSYYIAVTEYNSNDVWHTILSTGYTSSVSKANTFYIRCVRDL